MTMVITCSTPECIFQVSDRRLTRGDGSLYDDDAHKNVLLNTYVFGYAGLAALEGELTYAWLVKNTVEVSNQPIQQILEHIQVRAAEAVHAHSAPKHSKHLAFVMAGWSRVDGSAQLLPVSCIVSNAWDAKSQTWLDEPVDEFDVTVFLPPKEGPPAFQIGFTGYIPPVARRHEIMGYIRGRTAEGGMKGTVAALLDVIAEEAEQDASIGKGIMAVSLPRRAIETWAATRAVTHLFGPPTPEAATFLHVPTDGSRREFYGPPVVAWGSAMQGVTIGFSDP